jgi:hypothetical protein
MVSWFLRSKLHSHTNKVESDVTFENLPNSFGCTVQHESPDKEDDEDDVGEGCREVDDLAARLDALAQATEDDDPRE